MLRADYQFHDILVDITRGDVELTPAEAVLFTRTMNDLFNVRGPLWAFVGFAGWRRMFPNRVLSSCVAGLYSMELTWNLHDKYPVQTFFRDLAGMDPNKSSLARRLRTNYPRIAADRLVDRRGVFARVWDVVRLKRTRTMLFSAPFVNSASSSWIATLLSGRGSPPFGLIEHPGGSGELPGPWVPTRRPSYADNFSTGAGRIRCDFGLQPVSAHDMEFIVSRRTSPGRYAGTRILQGGGRGGSIVFSDLFDPNSPPTSPYPAGTANTPAAAGPGGGASSAAGNSSNKSFLRDISELSRALKERRKQAKQNVPSSEEQGKQEKEESVVEIPIKSAPVEREQGRRDSSGSADGEMSSSSCSASSAGAVPVVGVPTGSFSPSSSSSFSSVPPAAVCVRDVPLKSIWAVVAGDTMAQSGDMFSSPVWRMYGWLGRRNIQDIIESPPVPAPRQPWRRRRIRKGKGGEGGDDE